MSRQASDDRLFQAVEENGARPLITLAGISLHSRPSKVRPPVFGERPPHCLKKNGTPASLHWSRISRTQSIEISRRRGPLSPPTMTQSIPDKSIRPRLSSRGSTDRNRTAALVRRKVSIRGRPCSRSSTLTPHHALRNDPR